MPKTQPFGTHLWGAAAFGHWLLLLNRISNLFLYYLFIPAKFYLMQEYQTNFAAGLRFQKEQGSLMLQNSNKYNCFCWDSLQIKLMMMMMMINELVIKIHRGGTSVGAECNYVGYADDWGNETLQYAFIKYTKLCFSKLLLLEKFLFTQLPFLYAKILSKNVSTFIPALPVCGKFFLQSRAFLI